MYQRLISVKEAAELLNLSAITVYRMVKEGRMEARKLGSRVLLNPQTLNILEIPENPEVKVASKLETKRDLPTFSSILKELIPELNRTFNYVPEYGEVGFRVVFHDSQVVRVETTNSVSRKVNKSKCC